MKSLLVLLTLTLGLLAIGVEVAPVDAQLAPNDQTEELRDLRLRLKFGPSYRGDLARGQSFRSQELGQSGDGGWSVHYYDQPKPSVGYFEDQETVKWSYDMIPGLNQHLREPPPGYRYWGPPPVTIYNYYYGPYGPYRYWRGRYPYRW